MYASVFTEFAVLLFFVIDHCDAIPGKICKIPSADAGTCTLVNKCDPLYAIHKKRPKTPEEDAFYRQSVGSCGGGGHKLKVCCPPPSQWSHLAVNPVSFPEPPMVSIAITNEVYQPIGTRVKEDNPEPVAPAAAPVPLIVPSVDTAPLSTDKKWQAWLTNYKMSENITETCGIDTNSAQRIVGGNATEIDEYPWLALLEYEPKRFKCGGSLISRSHVLTAAHCLYTEPTNVRLSEYNITSEPTDYVEVNGGGVDSINVTIVEVQWTRQHPEHVVHTSKNDIGIVKMKQEVEYGDFIKPICLPARDYRNVDFTVATKFTVAGWGTDGRFENSDVKRSVFVPYVPIDVCNEKFVFRLSETQQICAGGEIGKDSCRGDSGGPLMYEDVANSNFVLVGIVSTGHQECGKEGYAGVYTYVYHYVEWIKRTINAV